MSTSTAATPRKAPPRTAPASVKAELMRIEASSLPWWGQAPHVAKACLQVAILPLRVVSMAADAAVSLSFVGLGAAIYLWWSGRIADETVANLLGQIGNRLLGIVKSSGLI